MAVLIVKGCITKADNQIRTSVTTTTSRTGSFTQTVVLEATVVPKEEQFVPVEGVIVQWYCQVGDAVAKKDKIAKADLYGKQYVKKTTADGVISRIEPDGFALSTQGNILSFSVNETVLEKLKTVQSVEALIEGNVYPLVITGISKAAVYQKQENRYEVYASCPALCECLYKKWTGTLQWDLEKEGTIVPLDCVVQVQGKTYVVYPSWLNHTMDLEPADYEEVEIAQAAKDEVLLKESLRQNELLLLSDEAYIVLYELLRQ